MALPGEHTQGEHTQGEHTQGEQTQREQTQGEQTLQWLDKIRQTTLKSITRKATLSVRNGKEHVSC